MAASLVERDFLWRIATTEIHGALEAFDELDAGRTILKVILDFLDRFRRQFLVQVIRELRETSLHPPASAWTECSCPGMCTSRGSRAKPFIQFLANRQARTMEPGLDGIFLDIQDVQFIQMTFFHVPQQNHGAVEFGKLRNGVA